jgi:hypothetical protein
MYVSGPEAGKSQQTEENRAELIVRWLSILLCEIAKIGHLSREMISLRVDCLLCYHASSHND